jgi:ferrous iron transport protein A
MILVYSFAYSQYFPNVIMDSMNLNMDMATNHMDAFERAPSNAVQIKTLAEAAIGERFIVSNIIAPADVPEWRQQLEDIGFIAGEPVTIMARGAFGGDPLVVRIGLSTFALRRAEAACIMLDVDRLKAAA